MATIAELTAVITADISGLTAGVSEANQQLNDLGKGAGQAGKDVGKAADGFNAAGKLMAAGGAAMLAPMVDAVRGAANLQQAMDQVGVAFNATDEQAAALQDTILDVASSTIFGAQEVADAANILGKAGASAEDVTGGLLQATADFAAATGTQLPVAADILSRVSSQWGVSGEEMIDVADDLTTVMNSTSLGSEDLLGGLANLSPMMRLLGADLVDTSAAMGYFKDQGLSAREVGTSLTNAMNAMIAPTEKQAEAMANVGLAAEDFFEIGADGQRQFIGWADALDLMNERMSEYDRVSQAAFLKQMFGQEAFDALGLGILSDTDKLRDLSDEMRNNTGIARRQSDALTDNLLGSIEELGGAYDKLRVRMGDPFLDPLQAGVEGVTGLVNALADADPAVQGFVGKLMAGAGGLLMFGGGALFGIGKLMDLGRTAAQGGRAIMDLGKMVGGAGKSLLDFGKNVLPTVGKAATGVGKSVMDMGRKLAQLGPVAMDAGRSLMRGVGTALPKIGKAAVNAGKSIMRSLAGLGPVGLGLAAALGVGLLAYESNFLGFGDWVDDQVATKIKPALEAAGKQFKSTVEGLGAFKDALMAGDWNSAWDQSIGGLGRFKDTHFAEQIAGLGAFKDALMAGDWDAAWDQSIGGLQRFKDENFSENLKSSIDGLGAFKDALMAGDWEGAWDQSIGGIGRKFEEIDLSGKLQGVTDGIADWFQDTSDLLMGTPDQLSGSGDIVKGSEGLVGQLADSLGLSLETLPTLMSDKIAGLGNPFAGVGEWLQQGMDEIGRFFMPQEMPAGLGGAGFGDTSGISQWFDGILQGFADAMPTAEDVQAVLAEKGGGFMQAIGDNILGPLGQFLFPSQDALAGGEGAALGDPAKIGEQFGAALLNTFTDPAFADSLQSSIESMPDEAFQATGSALLGAINKGMGAALTQPMPGAPQGTAGAGQTMGQQMVQTLADGLATSLQAEGASDALIPAVNAFGNAFNTTLDKAMTSTLIQQSQQGQGRVGAAAAGGIGGKLVQSLADGLTTSLQAEGTTDKFIPAVNALGGVLNAAMQQTAQQGQQAAGDPAQQGQQATGFGSQMVQGMATGLASGITNADPALFVPVTNALGSQLGAAMGMAAQQTQPPGGVGPVGPAVPAMGTDMVTGLAQGLTDSIANTPPETFYPVANALGSQLGTALETAMTQTVGVGQNQSGGMVGAGAAGGIGSQMVADLATGLTDSIANAPAETFQPVGDALGAKLGEALQVVAEGGGEFDVSEQVGTSVGSMLQTGIEQADFTGVGDQLSQQLSDQMGQAIEQVSSEISDQMSQITEAIGQAVEQMGEAISQATESVSQAVEDMSGSIEDAVGAVSDAVAEMGSAVEEAAGQMEEAASSAAEAAGEVGDAAAEAAEAVSQAMQEMAASVQEAAGAIEGAAGQIVAALNSIATAAGAAGSAIGAALSGGFSSELGIQSPSKVFIGFGKNIVQGLAIGMGGNNAIMARGSNKLAQQSMQTLATAIGMGSPAKKFMPHGRSIADGMLQGMLQQAKGRIQSAMGQMAGAVGSGMGKVKSAVESGMARVKGEAARGGAAAGEAAAAATGEGMSREERRAERAARKLWRRAYRELMDGVGAARFLGEAWAREFWEGMLDSNGSLAFAQYVTQQIAGAAENAVAAALGRISGLATQLEIVADTISDLQSEIASLESEQSGLAGQAQQARLSALQRELSLQRQITQELERRLKTEVSAAHQAHIRAVQTRSVAAQADYEDKLRRAVATDGARAESAIRETELAAVLDAMQQAVMQQQAAELAARQATVAAELAAKRQALAQEEALQRNLQQQQMTAQRDYVAAVVDGSNDRIRQLQKELRKASGADRKQTIKAEIALERQRIATAQQLAAALDQQAAAANPEALAQANAQVQFLTQQLAALGQVDVGSLLSGIASDLGKAASALGTAAGDLGSAASALGSADASAGMSATAAAAGTLGQQIDAATGGMGSMANKYREVMDQMNAEGYAFQAQFKAMTEKVRGDAATGGQDIGLALGEGIVGKITEGGPALQQTMLDGLQRATDAAETEAATGGTDIAGAFGDAMRGQLGVELPQVHQDILAGMNKAVDETSKEASQGGKEIMTDFGTAALGQLAKDGGGVARAMKKPVSDGVNDARKIASQGGRDIGSDLAAGVQQGVQSQAQNIANTAAQTVRDAIKAAKQAAQSNSPSRRMMDLGDDMGLGLVLGLRGRHDDAEDASARLVHIPLSPASGGGVTGRRALRERHTGRTIHIENLNLPGVHDPQQFIAAMERLASANGVASGR